MNFHKSYRPITARPFLSSQSYREYQPGSLLRPFISCYWSTEGEADEKTDIKGERGVLVIPDTCMDVIIHINHTRQSVSGYLCSMQDAPFFSVSRTGGDRVSVFAIRFYFWAAHLFLNMDFKDTRNRNVALMDLGREWNEMYKPLPELFSMEEKIRLVEKFLLNRLDKTACNSNLFNSFYQIIAGNGRNTVKEICSYSCISQRQMERQFLQNVGLPIKRISNLVRYQNVWSDMVLSQSFDMQDAVYQYGYADQSHLLKEFKKFHGTSPEEARRIAYLNRR